MISLLALALPAATHAADLVEQPEFLKADVGLFYAFDGTNLGLTESGEALGRVQHATHRMGLRGEMGVAPGTSVFLQFTGSPSNTIGFTEPRTMGWDPKEDQGSLLNGLPIEEGLDPYSAGGFESVWLGVRGTPFSETREAKATWLIEGALRTPDKTNLYTGDGSGDGALALRLSNVFATTRGLTHPYIAAHYTATRAYSVDGMEEGEGFDPSDRIHLVAGAEFDVWEKPATGQMVSVEGAAFFAYNSPAIVPSGLYLPSVLPGTEMSPTTATEYSEFGAGFGVHWMPIREMKVDFNMNLAWPTPHRVESSYPVYSAFRSRSLGVGLAISYLYR